MENKERIYLDNASTTNLGAEVLSSMLPVLSNNFGNSSSMHSFGKDASDLIENSRNIIAETINASADEIYFTSGGSEANSMALVGLANANRNKGNHIIVSKIEHSSVMEACRYLESDGFSVTYLDVDSNGFVNFAELLRAINSNTILISIIAASNKLGTIQNIKAISQTAHEKGIIFHTDAVQLYGHMDIDVQDLGIDAMSISAHKIYGPKGVGSLYISNKIKIAPIIFGNEENKKRGGTINTAGVVGFAKACEVAMRDMKTNNHKIRALSEYFITNLTQAVENVKIVANTRQKLPNIINVLFVGVDGESLLTKLDINGIAVSTESANYVKDIHISHVLTAIGLNNDDAKCTIRFSIGKNNSYEELEKAIAIIAKSVAELREFSSTYGMKTRKRKGDNK